MPCQQLATAHSRESNQEAKPSSKLYVTQAVSHSLRSQLWSGCIRLENGGATLLAWLILPDSLGLAVTAVLGTFYEPMIGWT
jgi:hypothetical protein